MCKFKSFIATEGRVLYSEKTDAHEIIIADNHLKDGEFVRVELSPGARGYEAIDEYVFKTDQDILPDWWDPVGVEKECRRILKEIMVFPLVNFPGNLYAYDGTSFPVLANVGGNLDAREGTSFPVLANVGSYLDAYEGVSFPVLANVGGNLYARDGTSFPVLANVKGKQWPKMTEIK